MLDAPNTGKQGILSTPQREISLAIGTAYVILPRESDRRGRNTA
jgi:hypothetical protein